jgi:hypothetical protein
MVGCDEGADSDQREPEQQPDVARTLVGGGSIVGRDCDPRDDVGGNTDPCDRRDDPEHPHEGDVDAVGARDAGRDAAEHAVCPVAP